MPTSIPGSGTDRAAASPAAAEAAGGQGGQVHDRATGPGGIGTDVRDERWSGESARSLAGETRLPRPTRAWWIDVWVQMLRRKPLGTVGAVIVVVMIAAAALAELLSPYGFAQTSLTERFIAMNASHWL